MALYYAASQLHLLQTKCVQLAYNTRQIVRVRGMMAVRRPSKGHFTCKIHFTTRLGSYCMPFVCVRGGRKRN